MGAARASKGPTPNAIAAMITCLLLLVGFGVSAYFIELRGAGLQSELQGGHAVELLILAGAMLVVAGTAHFAVAGAVRQSRGSSGYRALVGRALDLDYADPESLDEFDVVPELRELVAMLMAEKSQTRETGDRLETLSGELSGLADGMRRSSGDLRPLRGEGLSDDTLEVTRLWNEIVERVRNAESSQQDVESAPAVEPVVESPQIAPGFETLLQRLDGVESELRQLRATASRPGVPSAPAAPATPAPANRPAVWSAGVARADSWFEPGPRAATPLPSVRPAAVPYAAPTPAAPARPVGETRFEDIDFPHFVGKPVRPIPDRVEISYEGRDGEEPEDLPASALLFESEEDEGDGEPVVDLRLLGAVEFRE